MQMGSITPHTLVHPVTQRPLTPPRSSQFLMVDFWRFATFSQLIFLRDGMEKQKFPSPSPLPSLDSPLYLN